MTLLCFDLDGTILDPMEGIHRSLLQACEQVGIPCPSREEIKPYVGLDLSPLFRQILGGSLNTRILGSGFWKSFAEQGVFSQRVYDGAHLMLARLKRQGHRLFLLTGHPVTHAKRALHHFDLGLIFDDVIGPQEGWQPKHLVLESLARDGGLESGGFLVGDRADDMAGSLAHGLKAVGITYGFGSRAELVASGALSLLDSVHDLDTWLQGTLNDPEIHDPFSRSE